MISATVVFYLLTQVKSEDGILTLTSCKAQDRISIKIKPRTIESFEDFIVNDLFPGMSQNDFVRTSTDQLRLATQVTKFEPTYVSRSADQRQAVEDLISSWFRPNQSSQVPTLYVIIVREVEDGETEFELPPISKEEEHGKKKVKNKEKWKPKIKAEATIKPEPSARKATKKRSFSVALPETESEEPDLLSPGALFNSADTTEHIANRTRNRHALQQEDIDRAAQ